VTTTREVNQEPKIPEISMYIDKNQIAGISIANP
jgi:hypothetical protein